MCACAPSPPVLPMLNTPPSPVCDALPFAYPSLPPADVRTVAPEPKLTLWLCEAIVDCVIVVLVVLNDPSIAEVNELAPPELAVPDTTRSALPLSVTCFDQ